MATRKKNTKKNTKRSSKDIEDPQVQDANDEAASDDELDEVVDPADVDSESDSEVEDFDEFDIEADDGEDGDNEDVFEMKAQVEDFLFKQAEGSSAKSYAVDDFDGAGNILGVGIGAPEFDMFSNGEDGPGSPVLNVYLAETDTMENVRRCLHDDCGARAISDDSTPVNVHVTGLIDAQPHRHRARPAPGGISTGHFRITAGTLGCLARGRRGSRRRRVLMLSNNHVLANSNNARAGDSIIQPGRADGGRNPRDRIAVLEKFVRIDFAGRPNYVDAATGWCWHRRVRKDLIYRRGSAWRHFRISSRPRACRNGLIVGKSGRTTQLTTGRVVDCNATIRVNYGGGKIALFRDQITVRGLRGNFSAGGDSGSVIWTWDRRRNPVGLLFAGGGGYTFANKIGRVLRALDISLYT